MPNRRIALLALLLSSALVLLLVACGGSEEKSPATTTAKASGTPAASQPASSAQPASSCPAATGTAPEPDMTKKYNALPPVTIDTNKDYDATVHTVRGDFKMVLHPQKAPQTVNSFIFLAKDGFYDGVTFHRVEPSFVVQGGDPTGTGSGGPGYSVPAEFNDTPFERGILGMARSSDPNSGGSQWFVVFGNASHLTGQYTAFGQVTAGMDDVVACIQRGDAIISIDISEG